MRIDDEQLRKFREGYREEFREEISPAEAHEMLSRLVAFYQLLARPLPDEVTDGTTESPALLPPDVSARQ